MVFVMTLEEMEAAGGLTTIVEDCTGGGIGAPVVTFVLRETKNSATLGGAKSIAFFPSYKNPQAND